MILLDTSGLLSAMDAAQPEHHHAAAVLTGSRGPLVLSPFVVAELDYLLGRRVGPAAQRAFLREVGAGAYQLASITEADVSRASELIDRYAGLAIGIADASIVVLAERLDCPDVLTLDERHFRALPGPGGRPLRLLPADA